jgi:hypothetical protein
MKISSAVLEFSMLKHRLTDTKLKVRGFGPHADYTDRATAACWRNLCQLLRIEGVAWSAQRIPTVVNLGFLDQSRYFSFK